jgi:hypothetical protein
VLSSFNMDYFQSQNNLSNECYCHHPYSIDDERDLHYKTSQGRGQDLAVSWLSQDLHLQGCGRSEEVQVEDVALSGPLRKHGI